jgi:hypothetical protein
MNEKGTSALFERSFEFNQESPRSCIVLGVEFAFVNMIFRLEFGTALTIWYKFAF